MPHKFNVLYWKIKSFFREIYKMKFKALFRYFYDSEYRSQVNYMLNLVRKQPVKVVHTSVCLGNIVKSHPINYPEWVVRLQREIRDFGPGCLQTIKVFLDTNKMNYLVVDGNHRYEALMNEVGPLYRVKVELLVPEEQ